MDIEQHLIELFHSSIDTTMRTLDEQAPLVTQCSTLIAQCLLSEKKLLCCGEGISSALSQVFCNHLLNRFDLERPGLPAVNLSTDPTTNLALAAEHGLNAVFSQQVRALGASGDILFIVSNFDQSGAALEAIKAAHDREMIIVCLSEKADNNFSALLQPEDIHITITSDSRARVAEVQMQLINYISALIDQQIFGS